MQLIMLCNFEGLNLFPSNGRRTASAQEKRVFPQSFYEESTGDKEKKSIKECSMFEKAKMDKGFACF